MEFEKLFKYDLWANQKVLSAFQEIKSGKAKSEIEQMFSHVLAAQKIWAERIEGGKPATRVWPELTLPEMKQLMVANHEKFMSLIPKKDITFSYKNSKGVAYENKAEDILMQVIIHGQHHRAQIAKMLRVAGITPPGTDFLFFVRELGC